jgi:hypothetical protein
VRCGEATAPNSRQIFRSVYKFDVGFGPAAYKFQKKRRLTAHFWRATAHSGSAAFNRALNAQASSCASRIRAADARGGGRNAKFPLRGNRAKLTLLQTQPQALCPARCWSEVLMGQTNGLAAVVGIEA